MAEPDFRFGPFAVDRTRYRVLRGPDAIELTPKLLDLLLYLLDHAGTLVTKEQLLDALWPGANVTDNALAQAVSELRQALGDQAGTPRFIKTVARRGYRFIGPVTPVSAVEAAPPPATVPDTPAAASAGRSVFVMDFANVTGDTDAAWMSAGIAETVTADLRAAGQFRVVDRGRVKEAARLTDGSLAALCTALAADAAVAGSFQRHGDRIRITARIVNARTGDAEAHAKVDGPLTDIFALQDQVVAQFARELGLAPARSATRVSSRETPSLDAYRACTEAWLRLEALDLRELPQAIAGFERATRIDPRYGLALTGLASAELAAYEATRSDSVPARERLDRAIAHARQAVALDDTHAEAHATLALVLVSAWETQEAVQTARKAVALEPGNWRHFFRLGHASWGDERLTAAGQTLALYPDFAFAFFQAAMVHVARGDLREAETLLRQGAAVQDRQVARGDRYPALGLHWLLAAVRLALGDPAEAVRELEREAAFAEPHRLYGREYQMSAAHWRGACLLRLGRHDAAVDAFEEALALYPDHAPSYLGLAAARRAMNLPDAAERAMENVKRLVQTLSVTQPIAGALVESQRLVLDGETAAASALLCTTLASAPPGFAAWTVPVEPLLYQVIDTKDFAPAFANLVERAR